MQSTTVKKNLRAAVLAVTVFLLGVASAVAQQQVNLSAGPTTLTMPDGSSVPMWGYSCGALVANSKATCSALNSTANTWAPVVISVATGQDLQINLTNNLSFANGNSAPTSLMIVGQVGGGLGSGAQYVPSPSHATQTVTWPTANTGPTNTPPPQGPRVQSFSTEVAVGATTKLKWTAPRPGTYLLESGTHPSVQGTMGLYGMVVVTAAPSGSTLGTAYPGVTYSADLPVLLSEIDPVQNNAVNAAVNKAGFSELNVWSGQPGGCGNPSSSNYQTCYPPVVNYTPLYYLINGVAFDKTNPAASLIRASVGGLCNPVNGNVLVRFVNAGARMHVPSIVGPQTGPTASGFSLIAEDGNPLPGTHRVQSEVFMAAGKTYDVMINAPPPVHCSVANTPTPPTALPVYDRELSLSGNAIGRDAGMLAYLSINGAAVPNSPAIAAAVANADTYNSLLAGQTLTVADVSKGVIANDVNVYGVKLLTPPTNGTVTLNSNGTFTYVPSGTATTDSFTYEANGNPAITATVTLAAAVIENAAGITVNGISYTSNTSTFLKIAPPGVLSVDSDAAGYPLSVNASSLSIPTGSGLTLNMDSNGGFNASVTNPGTYTFTYQAQNTQGTTSATAATVTLVFPPGSGIAVSVVDGKSLAAIAGQDYRWIIEEDRSFYIDPTKITNLGASSPIVPLLGTNFHTSDMPYVAQGCTGPLSCESGQMIIDPASGTHSPAVCDVGNGVCRTTASQQTAVLPGQVVLDPTKRYYISVLPGDAANPFQSGNQAACAPYNGTASAGCGHSMGGAPISPGQTSVQVLVQQDPFPPGKLSVEVFEDDFPLNGEQDAGGGVDVLASNEPGLGGFNILLWDDMGGSGDVTGQMTYDMFNQPLTNSLDGTMDPASGFNACPITQQGLQPGQGGITGMIVTCPKYESDGLTLSPLAGQAVVANLMPGRFSVQAIPGADRIARGEEWLQTNTLDGQKAHDSFIRIGEPAYFQEFGPAGYHVSIGFANPGIINNRLPGICNGTDLNLTAPNCSNTVTGKVTTVRMSRTPDERLYSSGSHDSFYFTQCYVSMGDPDGEDFAFTKCNPDGTFSLSGVPSGSWRVTVFDQWNDMLVDGLSTPVGISGANGTVNMGDIATNQWQSNVYTRTFLDDNRDGVSQSSEAGLPFLSVAVRYRDGSLSNGLVTDFNGTANFNEEFPLFNWYVVETDTTRYKATGIHTVYDSGGPADGTVACGQTGYPPCGTSTIGKFLANTAEQVSVPANLRVPGAVYCGNADCNNYSIQNGSGSSAPPTTGTSYLSTGRIDPPWVPAEGWQGYSGQNNFIEFGKEPYVAGENGGIKGHVIYASTRPFDDPYMLVQTQWEPLVPHVTMNLYQEGVAADGITPTLTLVDTTQTSSWDDWAQGFRSDGVPNMNCPGQTTADLFYFSLFNQQNYLNLYNAAHGGPAAPALPDNSQYKCYDGMHNWNQLQPAPYDGMYRFPSITSTSTTTGMPLTTNCTICKPNTVVPSTDLYYGTPMLPSGKYVVEVVPPPGYELVKEEDKNILIGDNFIAPVTQEFGALGNIFIIPDQAQVAGYYNANNPQNPTQGLGAQPNNGIVPGFVPEPTWPCVGQSRIVPDYISLFPQSKQVSPFAGATRNLCDRKEVTLSDQAGAIAKFYIFTSTHKAAKFTGVITDDFTSEFDPFSPQFGEKFAPANMPIAVKDWTGAETNRVYSDWWGDYDGLTYSTWEVNPPNPTGYSPTMMVLCMNDRGPITEPAIYSKFGATAPIADPLFNPAYSQFCYELPYMPGQTDYLDTPVVPTSAFSAGYNHPDCSYPAATPAVSEVDGDGKGPWVAAAGHTLTIKALGDQTVPNYAYSGPSATAPPFNQQTITRHYGFGSQCTSPTAGSATCSTLSSVIIGGVAATITSWSDTSISVTVPHNVPGCAVQQQTQYGGSFAQCGELLITAGNGKQSVDTVTVTIGGKAPTYVVGNAPMTQYGSGALQQAIDKAAPGDLIMVPPGTYTEMLLMWKPVRLQGVGAASSIIDANTQPAGKLDPWRQQVNCLFGLALNGTPFSPTNPYNPSDPTNNPANGVSCPGTMQYFSGVFNNPEVDRLPLEGMVGWDTTVNGNLAQLLQEPTLMGAYEGAAITVLSKGVNTHGLPGYYGSGSEATFPTGSTVLTTADCTTGGSGANPYPSNFQCNPSSIDGLGLTDASQGGGGIFVHAWAHNLQIANNRVFSNIGTLSGGMNIGQGEFPDAYLNGTVADSDPGSCNSGNGLPANTQLPYCFNLNVNVHHNSVTLNASIGDELFSATPAGAGGVSFTTGADNYKFDYNWVCGNMSAGDGGGFAHLGFVWNGDVEHNTFLFNQSLNPTIPTNGGGLIIMGAAPDGAPPGSPAGTECGTVTDVDCVPGLSDGSGPGLVINANLIQGNAAEAGSGGGLRFQAVNGTEVSRFPGTPANWYSVTATNNIIVDNVAGWDGAGVSLEDALAIRLINNTIASNDTTASAGVLFNTIGAPLASNQSPPPNQTTTATTSAPQPAGLVSMANSPQLEASISGLPAGTNFKCPTNNPGCAKFSNPYMANNLFWQNRSFYIGVGALSPAYQQNIVTLYNAVSGTVPLNQTTTGSCVTGSTYWDIGVRGDTVPGKHDSGYTMAPTYSLLTNASENGTGTNNILATNPSIVSQYCDGSRVPPEFAAGSFNVPPGISDATVPNPIFNLSPNATVDEGNNWINLTWGPLSMANPVTGVTLGNYALASGSAAIDYVPSTSPTYSIAPNKDFFGNPRPDTSVTNRFDVGAIEYQGNGNPAPTLTSIAPNTGVRATSVPVTLTGTNLSNATAVAVSGTGVTVSNFTVVNSTTITATFTITNTATVGARSVTVNSTGGTSNAVTFTVTAPSLPTLTSIAPNTGVRGTSVPVTLTGTNLTGATAVTVSGTGVTVGSFTVVNSTSITATLNITAGASLTARTVSVTTAGGTSNNVTFTVVGSTLTSIAPNTGVRGTSVPVTLTGTNLTGATAVTVSGAGVAVSNVVVVNSTTVTATFTIAAGAALGSHNVSVTTPGGPTNTVPFTVQGATLTSISPTSGLHNTTVPVTLTGTNLNGATGVTVSGIDVACTITGSTSTTVSANCAITNGAPHGTRNVTVSTPIGNTNSVTFTVN
jgi:hypothetical protein